MLKSKTFEVRDEGTFIPCIGIFVNLIDSTCYDEFYLLRRAGYAGDITLVLFTRLEGGKSTYDPYDWDTRTMQVAHNYVHEHWNELESGSVIDVQFILGETAEPKKSESETVKVPVTPEGELLNAQHDELIAKQGE